MLRWVGIGLLVGGALLVLRAHRPRPTLDTLRAHGL